MVFSATPTPTFAPLAPPPRGVLSALPPQPSAPGVHKDPHPADFYSPLYATVALPKNFPLGAQGLVRDRETARRLKEQANTAQTHRDYRKAVGLYQQALRYDPTYTDLWFNMAHTYISLGEAPSAILAFEELLRIDPTDDEARQNLAEQLQTEGLWTEAIEQFDTLIKKSPRLDSAKRQRDYLALRLWATQSGLPLDTMVQRLGQANLQQARLWATAFCTQTQRPDLLRAMTRVVCHFAPTQKADNVPNLAEYRYHNTEPAIRFDPALAFGHPAVLAAYWIHEGMHALDNDPYTSVTEEQDGYRTKIEFWAWAKDYVSSSGQEPMKDTNLDYSLGLWKQSPETLDERVARHYRMRDPHIAATSPNHPTAVASPVPTP